MEIFSYVRPFVFIRNVSEKGCVHFTSSFLDQNNYILHSVHFVKSSFTGDSNQTRPTVLIIVLSFYYCTFFYFQFSKKYWIILILFIFHFSWFCLNYLKLFATDIWFSTDFNNMGWFFSAVCLRRHILWFIFLKVSICIHY